MLFIWHEGCRGEVGSEGGGFCQIIQVVLNPMVRVFRQRRPRDRSSGKQTHRKCCTAALEMGEGPGAKGCSSHQELGQARTGFFPNATRGSAALLCLDVSPVIMTLDF